MNRETKPKPGTDLVRRVDMMNAVCLAVADAINGVPAAKETEA